jgi:hypothetical protein
MDKGFQFEAAKGKKERAFARWAVREEAWREAEFENAKKRAAAERAWAVYQAACVEVMDMVNN